MRKFRDFINIPSYKLKSFSEFLLNESINYTYKVPSSPQKQLFDFYLLSLFYQHDLNKILPGMEDNKQDLEVILEDAIKKITDSQQKLLLSAGLTSIASELRHVYDINDEIDIKQFFDDNGLDYNKFNNWLNRVLAENIVPAKGNSNIRDKAGKSIISSGYRSYEFVDIAQQLFDNMKWDASFGGKSWVTICKGWKQLYDAKGINEKIQAIDHMYDLQHNTGFALNKTKMFDGDWVKIALDTKYSGRVWELAIFSSIPQRIIGYLVKLSGVSKTKEKEKIDLSSYTAIQLYEKALVLGKRWPEAEPIIMKSSDAIYEYARYVIKGRWPEAEPIIMKDLHFAYYYARHVIKGRWPEAEPIIMKDPKFAYLYARHVIKGRWPEAEPFIMKDSYTACYYAKNVIKGRWPEAEPFIMKDTGSVASLYKR